MVSDKRITANRKNAKASTGPKTAAGKRRSRINALNHGLAIAAGSDPSLQDDINALAKVVAASHGEQDTTELARRIAEAEIDLLRIRKVRSAVLNLRHRNVPARGLSDVELNQRLERLERYERRAFSRRKRALRDMERMMT